MSTTATPTTTTPISILNLPLAPRKPPLAAVQAAVRVRDGQRIQRLRQTLVTEINALYNNLWSSQDQYADATGANQTLTPQQYCDAFGPAAGSLFGLCALIAAPLNQIAPGSVPTTVPAGQTVTANADGTVTIGTAPAPAPAPAPAV